MQSLQDDHDRYLAQLGPDNIVVKGLRAQLDTATQLQSPTAVAVEQAKTLLDLLLKHEPDDREAIQEARAALDAAKMGNGPRESDCYQSAETALKQATATVDSIHEEIEATRIEF